MGITSPLDGNPAEVIGGLRIGVTPLEMADAYGTLANGGTHVPATIINKVVFPDGSSENFGDPKPTRVFPDGQTYTATNVLKQVITSGTGTAAGYGCPAAGKTGTANNLENAWFVGYTPRMSTAVWVGYPQGNIPMADGFGGALAAPIWHDYMQAASGNYCGDFPQPTDPFHGQPVPRPLRPDRRLHRRLQRQRAGPGGQRQRRHHRRDDGRHQRRDVGQQLQQPDPLLASVQSLSDARSLAGDRRCRCRRRLDRRRRWRWRWRWQDSLRRDTAPRLVALFARRDANVRTRASQTRSVTDAQGRESRA